MKARASSIGIVAALSGGLIGCGPSAGSVREAGETAGASNGGQTAGGSGGQAGTATQGGTSGTASAGTSSLAGGSAGTAGSPSGGGPALDCGTAPSAAPSSAWVNSTGNLANLASSCGTLGKVVAKACSNEVVATVASQGLYLSADRGVTWTKLGTGAGSVPMTNHAFAMFFDPENGDVLYESGLHNDDGAFMSSDGGVTIKRLGTMTASQLISVDFTDPERKTMVVGTHGQNQAVFLSTDGGIGWTNIGLNLPAEASHSESPVVIDKDTFLLGCNQGDSGYGLYRTTDQGLSWSKKSDMNPSHFGGPLYASDGNVYWPIFNDVGFGKSTDLGETWTNIAENGEIVGITPIELPDGSIVVVGKTQLLRSTDQGASFVPIGEPLPWDLAVSASGSVTYSALTKTFYVSHWLCADSVAPDAIMSAGFDYESP